MRRLIKIDAYASWRYAPGSNRGRIGVGSGSRHSLRHDLPKLGRHVLANGGSRQSLRHDLPKSGRHVLLWRQSLINSNQTSGVYLWTPPTLRHFLPGPPLRRELFPLHRPITSSYYPGPYEPGPCPPNQSLVGPPRAHPTTI